MNAYIRKTAALLLVLLALLALSATACAAETIPGGTEKVKIAVEVKNGPKTPETYSITLTPEQETYPMPAGTRDGVYTLKIKGAGEAYLPEIDFDQLGVYAYTLRQLPGDNKKCSYSDAVYTLTVYVLDGQTATTLTHREKEEKLEQAVFTNIYPQPQRPDTPKTNDESNFPLYIAMAAASILVLAGLYVTRREEE